MAPLRRLRLKNFFLRGLLFPFNVITRLTTDSTIFIILIVICGMFSIGQNRWSNIPLLLSSMMASLWLLALWQGSRALRALKFRRTHSERVFANETLNVTVHLENRSRLPCAGISILESLENEPAQTVQAAPSTQALTPPEPNLVVAHGGTFLTMLPGRGKDSVRYTLKVRRRGLYHFGPTHLETNFPLGFFKSLSIRHAPGRLVVYPQLGEVDMSFFEELELAIRHTHTYRASRTEEDFRGLREYRHGDNPRWIHWRSTARSQKTLIKEFEEPQARRVLLILDTHLQRLGPQRFSALEMMVSFAGTLARDLARRGYELECVALQPGDRVVRSVISSERRNLDTLLEMLAGLRRDDSRTLAHLKDSLRPQALEHVYVLVLGLGSLRVNGALQWLNRRNNVVKVIDARGDDFRRTFRMPSANSAREPFRDEDLLLDLNEADVMEESSQS